MKHTIKRFFNRISQESTTSACNRNMQDVHVATCALFLEMAHLDDTFTREETEIILSILKEKYRLSDEHAEQLLKEAERELEESIDLWQFAKLINENYSIEEKMEVIRTLWEIVFVNGKMDRYEDYLMHKVATLLRLSNDKLIDAKLAVLDESSRKAEPCGKEAGKAAPKREEGKMTKVVFHLDVDEEKRLVMALNNMDNLLKVIPEADASVCLVANGSAVGLFEQKRGAVHGPRVTELAGKGVRFMLCNNSLTNLNLDSGAMLSGCEIIKAGIMELIQRQSDGYAYIKP
ncbi:MAG: TerB family tellurite resistance protein [Deltaproteobacteria bacterium]|nr:TerB family tellurite resistance protein [Deltaproteobacteria bacterium]